MKISKENSESIKSSVPIKSDLIGTELYYKSYITKGYTKFKVKNVILNKEIISNIVCFSIHLISENNNKYIYEQDIIFSSIPSCE